MSKAILIFLCSVVVFSFLCIIQLGYIVIVLRQDIITSRTREELLYKEVKNLDYEISVLTELQRNMKG